MITRQIVSFEELIKDTSFWNTVIGLVHDETNLLSVIINLSDKELHQVYHNDTVIGFFTVDKLAPNEIEIHAFIYPEYRRYSISALREMDKSHKESIRTSVWGTHSHVSSILKKMGFIHTHTDIDDIVKKGEAHDIEYFYKEKLNGQ